MRSQLGQAMRKTVLAALAMARLACCVYAGLAFLAPSEASADWQYTKWGMSADQVLRAAKGALQPCTPAACRGRNTEQDEPKLYGAYSSGSFQFNAFFPFRSIGSTDSSVA